MKLAKKIQLELMGTLLLGLLQTTPVYAVETQLGNISANPVELVKWFVNRAVFIGGGLAFLLFLGAGFTLLTSAGDPEKIHKGKEVITAAISGLFFIIFSVYLLRVIGYDILRIPDINK